MNISFIGSGNLAWHLAPALDNLGYVVKEVYSPQSMNATALTERLYQAEVKTTLDFSTSDSRIFIVAVSDDAILEVAQEIILPDESILVHTSGSQPLSILEFAATAHLGVLYPLQTFSKTRPISFKDIPLFVESSDEQTEKQLLTIARGLSTRVRKIDSGERIALHVAAVFASNFANHMLTISKEVMEKHELNFDWLKPLISETINKALITGPAESQTGPARRADFEILDHHMTFLKEDENLEEIYKVISQHIVDHHSGEG